MKKLIIFLGILLFSMDFELPNDLFLDKNSTQDKNITPIKEKKIVEIEKVFDDNFISLIPNINVCIAIDKQKFFKYIPSIINSVNAYLIYKNVDYSLKVKNINDNLSECNYTLIYSLDKNLIKALKKGYFYIPIYNKKEIETNNSKLFFGGIDFEEQLNKLANFIDNNKSIAINENTQISKKLLKYEKKIVNIIPFEFNKINYSSLKEEYIFFNTSAGRTAEVLSNITSKEINTKLQFATQIDYDPLLLSITQQEDIQKLLIANSLINIPEIIESFNLVLNSDIKYNWLNYSTSILLNKIYNTQTQDDEFYMNDFHLYIFNNQIEYKIAIFQIINGSFKKIDN